MSGTWGIQSKLTIKKNNQGLGGKIRDKVLVFRQKDIANMPVDCEGTVLQTGAIVMKPGEFYTELEVLPKSIKATSNTTGASADYNQAFLNGFEAEHPGTEDESELFIEKTINEKLLLVYLYCQTGKMKLIGDLCSPIGIKDVKTSEDATKSGSVISFESTLATSKRPRTFTGTLPVQTPIVLPADAVGIDLVNGSTNYTTNVANTVAKTINAFANPVDGLTFSIIGGGGAFPQTIAASSSIRLKLGASWTAAAGAFITFEVYQDGASTFCYVERARG